jgi:ParB/RepB/Spo0J family partition protein
MEAALLEIDVDLIDPNPEQPRVHFDETKLRELGQSIVEHGLEQAITVEISPDGRYMLRDGERRLRAHKLMGLQAILAIVKPPPAVDTERERLIGAFVANFQRDALNAIEEAKALQRMNCELGMSYQAIGNKLGMSKSAIANKVRLLALPDEWHDAIVQGLVSERQAASFLPWVALPDEIRAQTARPVGYLWDQTLEEGKSSDQIRRELSHIIYQASKTLDRVVWFDEPFDDPFCAQNVCRGCPESITSPNNRLGCINLRCFARKTELFRLAAAKWVEFYNVPLLPDGTDWYEVTIHWGYSVEEISLVPCNNRAILAYPWMTVAHNNRSGMLSPGIFLVCSKRSCSCVSRAKQAEKSNGKKEPEPVPVKPFWFQITTGDREWAIEKNGAGMRLSVDDVLEIVNRYCDEHNLDLSHRIVTPGQEFPVL